MPVLRTTQGHEEFEEAKREGIAFLPRRGPKRFLGERPARSRSSCARVRSVFDAERPLRAAVRRRGRDRRRGRRLHPRDRPEAGPRLPEAGRRRRARRPAGTIRVDRETLATSAPGVFAGGDVAFGPRNLIEAVANGKRAARSIHEYLQHGRGAARDDARDREDPDAALPHDRGLRGARPRDAAHARRWAAAPASRRSRPATTGPQAWRQAARCLVCHVQTIYDPEKCVLCSRCVDVCPEYCLAIVPFEELELPEAEKQRAARDAPRRTACRSPR